MQLPLLRRSPALSFSSFLLPLPSCDLNVALFLPVSIHSSTQSHRVFYSFSTLMCQPSAAGLFHVPSALYSLQCFSSASHFPYSEYINVEQLTRGSLLFPLISKGSWQWSLPVSCTASALLALSIPSHAIAFHHGVVTLAASAHSLGNNCKYLRQIPIVWSVPKESAWPEKSRSAPMPSFSLLTFLQPCHNPPQDLYK